MTFTVHIETTRNIYDKRFMLRKIYTGDDTSLEGWIDLFNIITQSSEVSGLPFELPTVESTVDELIAARAAFMDLPGAVYREWVDAITDVENLPPVEPEPLLPDPLPGELGEGG